MLESVHTASYERNSKRKTHTVFSDTEKQGGNSLLLTAGPSFNISSVSMFKHCCLACSIKLSKNLLSLFFDAVDAWLMKAAH